MKGFASRARGVALAELMAAMIVMTVVFSLSATCLNGVIRMRSALYGYEQRAAAAVFFLRRLARDVRESQGFAGSAASFEADGSTLVLRRPEGPLVYRTEGGRVTRIQTGAGEANREEMIDEGGIEIDFQLDGGAPRSARWVVATVRWQEPSELGVANPTLSLRIAPRNREGGQ
jgi:hypothetical protein